MEVARIALLLVAAALVCAAIRVQRPELASGVALAAGAAVLLMLAPDLQEAAVTISNFAAAANMNEHGTLILRATGISLIAEFAAQLCEDAGEKTLAGRIELVVRVALFAMAAPLITELFTLVTGVLA